jgi:hypothetical protein
LRIHPINGGKKNARRVNQSTQCDEQFGLRQQCSRPEKSIVDPLGERKDCLDLTECFVKASKSQQQVRSSEYDVSTTVQGAVSFGRDRCIDRIQQFFTFCELALREFDSRDTFQPRDVFITCRRQRFKRSIEAIDREIKLTE